MCAPGDKAGVVQVAVPPAVTGKWLQTAPLSPVKVSVPPIAATARREVKVTG